MTHEEFKEKLNVVMDAVAFFYKYNLVVNGDITDHHIEGTITVITESDDSDDYNDCRFLAAMLMRFAGHTPDDIKTMLIEKNKAYGSSALKPIPRFSKYTPDVLIKARIDDKLSRIYNNGGFTASLKNTDIEDTIKDLIGYLVLLLIVLFYED